MYSLSVFATFDMQPYGLPRSTMLKIAYNDHWNLCDKYPGGKR